MSTKDKKTDPFLSHEAMDRCSVMVAMVSDHLLEHKFVQDTPEVREKVAKAVDLLAEAYQDLGRIAHKDKE